MAPLSKFLSNPNDKELKRLSPGIGQVNRLEPDVQALDDGQLVAKSDEFRTRLGAGETVDDIQAEAFAVMREAIWRQLGQRAFDVQILGAIVLHQGKIAELKTGEGKTLVSSLTMYLNSLAGHGVLRAPWAWLAR